MYLNRIRIIICYFTMLFLMIFSAVDLFAQKLKPKNQPNTNLIAADKYFNNFEYYLAAKKYQKVIKKDTSNLYVLYKLAECYRFYYDYKNAELTYQKIYLKYKKEYPLAHFWYASMLKDNGNYLKALYHFEKFIKENKNADLEIELYREKAEAEIKGCYVIMDELSKPQKDFDLTCMPKPINSENSEYAPVIVINDSTLVVTSSRKGSKGNLRNTTYGGSASDVYRFKKSNSTEWESIKKEEDNFSKLNTPFNECGGSFTKDGKKYYFTRCDVINKKGTLEENTCGIYVSYLVNGVWETPIFLNKNINAAGHWNGQPSISPDGKIMFFVSKRPGGYGMHDIWYSSCHGNEVWGRAINLGDKINTAFTELSPRYYNDLKLLFFSSNGQGGLGGLDIFMAKEKESFEKITNLGMPFNSPRDDFYFVLGDKKGFLSSNRQNGIGNDDIFSFNIDSKKSILNYFIDSTGVSDVHPNILMANNNKPITDKALIASVDNSETDKVKSVVVEGRIVIGETRQPVENISILLVDEIGTTLKTTLTDKKGNYRFTNLESGLKYKVIFQQSSLFEKMENKNFIDENFNIKSSDVAVNKQFFDNIFFDFDSYELRTDAKTLLDKLIEFCKKDSIVQIEMYANTDSYGTNSYNKSLAVKRGRAASEYLISKGLPQSSIVINAVGEKKSIATNDTELGRQLNRRIEFYILGTSIQRYNNLTYTIESQKTIYSELQEYTMKEEELVELNGLTNTEVTPYNSTFIKKKIELNEFGAPNTHLQNYVAIEDSIYTEEELLIIKKNKEVNENFNFKNPEYLKYIDSIEAISKYVPLKNDNQDYYTVQSKNTLKGIALLYGIDVEKLKILNNLKDESIFVGQKLIIDFSLKNSKYTGYLVKEGDTIESIAKYFELSLEGLIHLNQLSGYTLQKNMIIRFK